jgi:hypothetical protein
MANYYFYVFSDLHTIMNHIYPKIYSLHDIYEEGDPDFFVNLEKK